MLQLLIVALIVAFAFCYALWSLLPAAAKKWLATGVLEWPLPAFAADALRPYTSATSGCGCDGCDRSAKPAAQRPATAPITFHPRRQR